MARGVNKVILIGNLGNDPDCKYLSSGNAVTNITLATSETWKDKQTGQAQERTEWHRVVFFNRLAEIAAEYLHKGSKVYIEGSLRTRKWQDQSGQDRYTTEIVASEMQMLDSQNPQPQQHYQQPTKGYQQPPQHYQQPTKGYQQPPQNYQPPQQPAPQQNYQPQQPAQQGYQPPRQQQGVGNYQPRQPPQRR